MKNLYNYILMENENMTENFIKPEQFNEKLDILNSSVDLLLDEFKKIYVISKMHPANQEYQQQYANMVSGLNQIQSKLFSVSNDVQVNIDKINKKMVALDIQIRREREKNIDLKNKLGIIENKSNASSELINDYTQIYDQRYLRNWALVLSTVICVMTIGSVFKKQGV
jgi:lipopolysaccharide/colanic/teichoic acid biosynthesis glycosyltransferase